MKYAFITQHKKTYPISLQCQVLGVSRSGYYHYQANVANRPVDPVHQEMLGWVKAIAFTLNGVDCLIPILILLN